MNQEAPDELINCQGHGLVTGAPFIAIVFPLESHSPVIAGDQPAIRYRDPMGIPGEIGQYGLRAREGPLGIDYPLGLSEGCQVLGKNIVFS